MSVSMTELPAQALTLAGQSLVLRPLDSDDPHHMQALLALHNAVFGSDVDEAWFDWKYGAGRSVGFSLWQDRVMLAHCGGIPRRFWQTNVQAPYLQIGDVMVHPDWRGILARQNPFSWVSLAMYSRMLGPSKPYRVGFGFPNDRHMRLVVKTGLAWHVGDMTQLRWTGVVHRSALGWAWHLEEIHASRELDVAHAWLNMQRSMRRSGVCAGERDGAHVRWRYLTRPDKRYRLMALRRPWSRAVAGVLVLSQVSPVQWLDWIGSVDLMPLACLAARIAALEAGSQELTAWCSARVVQALKNTGVTSSEKVAAIGVPVTSDFDGGQGQTFPWWLMGGDTDFL